MHRILFAPILVLFCFIPHALLISQQLPPYAANDPVSEPIIFAPGIISTGDYESHPQFDRDGSAFYFVKSNPAFTSWTICYSRYADGKWSDPKIAPFSGTYHDADPFITPDGKKFYFISNRPAEGKLKADLDIWVMLKTDSGWSAPVRLLAPINSDRNEWYPTVSLKGTLYFSSDREGGEGRSDIYFSRKSGDTYRDALNIGDAINSAFNDFEPCIAPDESYLVFVSSGRAEGMGGFDLFISYRQDGAWQKPTLIGGAVNSLANEMTPMISPDGNYFFWTSTRGYSDSARDPWTDYQSLEHTIRASRNGLGDIYQIDLQQMLLRK